MRHIGKKEKKKGKGKERFEKEKQEMKSVANAEKMAKDGMSTTGMCQMSHSIFHTLNILL